MDLLHALPSHHRSYIDKTPWPCIKLLRLEYDVHVSETWPLTRPGLKCFWQNGRFMVMQISNVKSVDAATVRPNGLLAPYFAIDALDVILKKKMLCWFGHVE